MVAHTYIFFENILLGKSQTWFSKRNYYTYCQYFTFYNLQMNSIWQIHIFIRPLTAPSLFLSKRNSIHIYKTFPAGKNISYLLDSDGIWAKLSWKKSLKKEVVHCYRFLNNTSLFICQFQNENWVVLTRIFLFFTADVVGNYIISTENTAHTKFLSFTAARDYNSPAHFTSVN